jgi:hypothetical protein
MSPYFDVTDGPSRAAERLAAVLAKREAGVDFVVPVERLSETEFARVPPALLEALPDRLEAAVFDVKQPDEAEPRSLHGKLVLLESDGWTAALVGSSNFSAPGLGLDGSGNVEIGIAIGSPTGDDVSRALSRLALVGERVDLNDETTELEAVEDPEQKVPPIPSGFVQVLGEPGPPARLEIELNAHGLPAEWWMRTPDDSAILDHELWVRQGRKALTAVDAPAGDLPFNVAIEWRTATGERTRTNLPVNVTDPGRLPAPAALRDLPVDALLRALASVRPLHEAVVDAVERHERNEQRALDHLDPLKRFSPTGQLLYRTRELSAALAGLRERLERPAATLDAFRWRLEGAFGPTAIADKLIEERRTGRSVEGEEAFMLAEIALTLANLDLRAASRFIPNQLSDMRAMVRATLRGLRSRWEALPQTSGLDGYVHEAFARAMR